MIEPFSTPAHVLPARFRHRILTVEAGSTLHGISIGNDDRDELSISVDQPWYVTGTYGDVPDVIKMHDGPYGPRSYQYRTAAEGQRSQPGDLDLMVHELRKFARLAADGNPTILQTFFVPPDRRKVHTVSGADLLNARSLFLSRAAGRRYVGYARDQLERMNGTGRYSRGAREGNRDPERVHKYAAHITRLTHQGHDLLRSGEIRLPMWTRQADHVKQIRQGMIPLEQVQRDALVLCDEIDALSDDNDGRSPLRLAPDWRGISRLLHRIHMREWGLWEHYPEMGET